MYSNTATLSKRRSSKLPVESVSNGVDVGRLLAHTAPYQPLALLLVRPIIRVIIFRVTQVILVVDFKFLGRLGLIVNLTDWCLIFTRVFIVAVIVIIFSAATPVSGNLFGIRGNHISS
jgi:hypothetical protein